MSVSWYYVKGTERVGPVEETDLAELLAQGQINTESYVWKKGMQNWERLKAVQELQPLLYSKEVEEEVEAPPVMDPGQSRQAGVDWESLDPQRALFTIKIGADRGMAETEYGPYSLEKIRTLFQENRINGKTLVFTPGMDTWEFLGEVPIYRQLSDDTPPVIEEVDRRNEARRPFVARLFFHDNTKMYEGVCRDISVGGLQVLVADFPGKVGDKVSLNVHPDNSEHSFVAAGKVVRLLEGGTGLSVRFAELAEDARQAIDSYLQSHED